MSELSKQFLGIDPGVNGGIAIWTTKGITTHKIPQPMSELLSLFRHIGAVNLNPVIVCESISPRPFQNLGGVVRSSLNFGALMMGLLACSLEPQIVTPQKWQKALGLNRRWQPPKPVKSMDEKEAARWVAKKYRERKKLHKETAQELFPELSITHQNADALLIMEYCRREYG
jgi:hypothetical protein